MNSPLSKAFQKRWDKLSPELKDDLKIFMIIDDAGK